MTAKLSFQVAGFIDMSNTVMDSAGGGFGSISGSSGVDGIYGSNLNDMIFSNGGDDLLSGARETIPFGAALARTGLPSM